MRILFLIAVATVGYLLYRLYFRRLLAQGRPGQVKIALVALGLLLLGLALTGRAPAVFVFIGALLTQVMRFAPLLVRFVPSLRQWLGNGSLPGGGPFGGGGAGAGEAGASGRVSQVRTRTLLMRLDQDSGEMSGTVLAGVHEGRELADMSDDELGALHEACRHDDPEALRLLEAWLVRERPESWGADAGHAPGDGGAGGAGGAGERPGGSPGGAGDRIGEAEAREILGVDEGATRAEILAAHRSLMTRLHPDKGGSNWLAARVNEARRVLTESAEA